MEAAAADSDAADITAPGANGEPYLKPTKPRVELDEAASPTAGRRFTRT